MRARVSAQDVAARIYTGDFFDGALCARKEMDAEWWTCDTGELSSREVERNHAMAISVCLQCPIMVKCAFHAIHRPQLTGIWGATTDETRKAFRAGMKK